MNRNEQPTIPAPKSNETLLENAPEIALQIALALDLLTGGKGQWVKGFIGESDEA